MDDLDAHNVSEYLRGIALKVILGVRARVCVHVLVAVEKYRERIKSAINQRITYINETQIMRIANVIEDHSLPKKSNLGGFSSL